MNFKLAFAIFLVFLACTLPARADWTSLDFDVAKNDAKAYTTNLPAGAFTEKGLHLDLKGQQSYTLTSTRTFSGDFSFDVQVDIPDRKSGSVFFDLVLINDQQKRKVVGTYENRSLAAGTDRATIQYFKDGNALTFEGVDSWRNKPHSGNMEVLRLHKIDNRTWFMQRPKQHAYKFISIEGAASVDNPCDEYKVGIVIRTTADAAITLNVPKIQISGTAVNPRDPRQRVFLFDMGAVNQELEDEYTPVSEFSNYSKQKGFGWVIPDPENVIYAADGIPKIATEDIVPNGFKPIPEGENANFLREVYWLQLHNKKVMYNYNHGLNFVDFFKKHLDLCTPLERDGIGMGKPYQFTYEDKYEKDIEERRGSVYMDDDLSTNFAVDLPNGHYNVLIGVGYQWSPLAGLEKDQCNVEINGRVRKTAMRSFWRRVLQHEVHDVLVENGQMNFRFFADLRHAMNPWQNHELAAGWQVQFICICPTEDKELYSQMQWNIIRKRGEVVRRITFVDGNNAVTRNEGNFVSLNSKPLYFLKVMKNYWPGESDHYTWYNLANVLDVSQSFRTSQHFFKPDWEERSYSDDYPWFEIDHMNTMFTWGCLASIHEDTILSFVPQAVSGEGNPTVDSRGRKNRWNVQPPLNSALGKEIQKEAYTMLANQLGQHPANLGHMIYDELKHPNDAGYDDQSLIQYWDYLQNRYKTIEALNADWGRTYKSFDEIQPPTQEKVRFWQYNPEWVHFREFRSWAQLKMVQSATDLVHKLEPGHFSWGAMGDYGTQSWNPAEDVDAFGWYTPYAAVSAARHFGKTPLCEGYSLNCEYASSDGRAQEDHAAAGPKKSLAEDENDIYNTLISSTFKGVKGFFSHWESDGVSHPFHRTTLATGVAKDQNGNFVQLSGAAKSGPPVRIERHALMVDAANQTLYRLGHLWLPAQPPAPKVLFPCTQASFFLDFFGDRPFKDFETVAMRILRSANLAADFMELPDVKDLSQYQMIVLSDVSAAISKEDAQRIRTFVAKGGKLLILNAGGFSEDSQPRRYWNKPGDVYPLKEFADLGGYRIVGGNENMRPLGKVRVTFAASEIAPEFSAGQPVGSWETSFYYEIPAGSTSTAFLNGTMDGGQKVVMGVINKDRSVVVVNVPDKTNPESMMHPIAKWARKLFDSWKIENPVTVAGVDDAWDLYAGCLVGPDYRLATLCNTSADKNLSANLQVKGLPDGDYAIIDVTGQPPEFKDKSNGGPILVPESSDQRQSAITAVVSARDLAQKGIPCNVKPHAAQIWLIRPMSQKVWNSVWPGALGEFASRGVTIACGTGPSDRPAADKIAAALSAKGFKATVVAASEVKLQNVTHEVRIKPDNRENKRHEDPSAWPLVDTFKARPVDIETSLVVVGSVETNSLFKHLAGEGTFIYDKVGEKITAAYPGPGRGAIGWVDAVNFAIYDLRSQARDAIVVGGSDPAGTLAAADTLASLFSNAIVRELPQPPAKGASFRKVKAAWSPPATEPAATGPSK